MENNSNDNSLSNLQLLEKELALKQLQNSRLLEITKAINANNKVPELLRLYTEAVILLMQIEQFVLIIKINGTWTTVSPQNERQIVKDKKLIDEVLSFKELKYIDPTAQHHPKIRPYDVAIPVMHKDDALAVAFIGGLNINEEVYNKIEFITTITSIIAVAIENKRMFKQQLQQEHLKRDIELAGHVQQLLIPDNKDLPNDQCFHLNGIYKPVYGVGGDYFNYLPCKDSDEFAFCIADISGKGIPAAIMMSDFQATLKILFQQNENLVEFIHALNKRVVATTQKEKFITFFIGKYNRKTRFLQYINAGHNPSVLVCGNDVFELDKGCTIIGAFDKLPEVELGALRLCEEALIVNYTDGLSDIESDDGEEFDIEHLKQFAKAHRYCDADDFNDQLMETLETFKGTQSYPDDIAIFTCKIK